MLKARFLILSTLTAVALGSLGCQMLEEQMADAMRANPVIQAHIGDLKSYEMDMLRTGNEPGENVFAFRVEGTKGSGLVVAEFITVSAEEEEIASGVLEMDSGEVFDLMGGDL